MRIKALHVQEFFQSPAVRSEEANSESPYRVSLDARMDLAESSRYRLR